MMVRQLEKSDYLRALTMNPLSKFKKLFAINTFSANYDFCRLPSHLLMLLDCISHKQYEPRSGFIVFAFMIHKSSLKCT